MNLPMQQTPDTENRWVAAPGEEGGGGMDWECQLAEANWYIQDG